MQKRYVATLAAAGVTLAFAAGYALGQAQAPAANQGLSAEALRSLDLSDEVDSIKGRPLRMRKITLQPGGVIGLHTHKDRPAVSYFLQGEVTYHEAGKPPVVMGQGQGIAEGKATTHWAENRGSVPAVWIAVDIPKD